MELYKINNLKQPLLAGEIIEMSNDDDLVQLFYRKSLDGSNQFFIELNAKIIASNKQFRAFRDKLVRLVDERDLKLQFQH